MLVIWVNKLGQLWLSYGFEAGKVRQISTLFLLFFKENDLLT